MDSFQARDTEDSRPRPCNYDPPAAQMDLCIFSPEQWGSSRCPPRRTCGASEPSPCVVHCKDKEQRIPNSHPSGSERVGARLWKNAMSHQQIMDTDNTNPGVSIRTTYQNHLPRPPSWTAHENHPRDTPDRGSICTCATHARRQGSMTLFCSCAPCL